MLFLFFFDTYALQVYHLYLYIILICPALSSQILEVSDLDR